MATRIVRTLLREAAPTPLGSRELWAAIAANPDYLAVIPSKTALKQKILKNMYAQKKILRTPAKIVSLKERRAGLGASQFTLHPAYEVKMEKGQLKAERKALEAKNLDA